MTLLVSNKPIRYTGRFDADATKFVKTGVRVGMMWVSEEKQVHCHVCDKKFTPPELHLEYDDAMEECPHCKTIFVFAKPIFAKTIKE